MKDVVLLTSEIVCYFHICCAGSLIPLHVRELLSSTVILLSHNRATETKHILSFPPFQKLHVQLRARLILDMSANICTFFTMRAQM